MPAHRRDFLKSSLAASTLVSMGATTVPTFLARSARAAGGDGPKANDRVLVVVQLIGGNDGLNTVVPLGLDGYARGRRALRLPPARSTRSARRSACTRGWGGWPSSSRTAGPRSCRGSATRTPTARTSGRWRSGSRPDLETGDARDRLARPGPRRDAVPAGRGRPGAARRAPVLPLALQSKRTEVPSLESLEQIPAPARRPASDRRAGREALDAWRGSIGRATTRCSGSSGGAP